MSDLSITQTPYRLAPRQQSTAVLEKASYPQLKSVSIEPTTDSRSQSIAIDRYQPAESSAKSTSSTEELYQKRAAWMDQREERKAHLEAEEEERQEKLEQAKKEWQERLEAEQRRREERLEAEKEAREEEQQQEQMEQLQKRWLLGVSELMEEKRLSDRLMADRQARIDRINLFA